MKIIGVILKKISPHAIALSLVLVSGSILRFFNLGNVIFYWDEPLHSVRIAAESLRFVLAHNDASAFFTLLVHLLLPLGKLEIMARLPSAVFGVGTIIIIYLLGKYLFSKREGLIAAFFVSFSPLLIRYSQYSRAYSVYIFLSLLSLFFFLKSTETNQTKHWVAYSLATIINLYNHMFALFVLPVFGIYASGIVARGFLQKKSSTERKFNKRIFYKFVLWTFIALFLVAILYLPDQRTRTFMADSLDKATMESPGEKAPIFPAIEVMQNLLSPRNPIFFFCFLFLILIGIVDLLKKEKLITLFVFLYITLPYVMFILINPSPAHMLSIGRYMAYMLPLLLLLIVKGLFTSSRLFFHLVYRFRDFPIRKDLVLKIFTGILVLSFLFRGSDFKGYYLDFWRLNTFKIQKTVSDHLKNHIRKDSFIFFNSYPASNLIMLANPLTKKLKVEEFEIPIRTEQNLADVPQKILYYKVRQRILEWYIKKPVDFWVVTQLNKDNQRYLLEQSDKDPSLQIEVNGEYCYLHFKDTKIPLWQKIIQMTQIFLNFNFDPQAQSDLHLIAARASLYADSFKAAVEHLKLAQLKTAAPFSQVATQSPVFAKILDPLFGLKPSLIRKIGREKIIHSDIAKLLIRQGDQFRREQKFDRALQAYDECVKLSPDFNLRISNRTSGIANRLSNLGQREKAITFVKKSLELNPDRIDLRFFLGELYRKEGRLPEAFQVYRQTFETDSFSEEMQHRLQSPNPLLIIQKTKTSLRLFFRTEYRIRFSGRIQGDKRIRILDKGQWAPRDTIDILKNKLSFALDLDEGKIRTLVIDASQRNGFLIDLRFNGRRDLNNVLVIDTNFHLTSIPFSLD